MSASTRVADTELYVTNALSKQMKFFDRLMWIAVPVMLFSYLILAIISKYHNISRLLSIHILLSGTFIFTIRKFFLPAHFHCKIKDEKYIEEAYKYKMVRFFSDSDFALKAWAICFTGILILYFAITVCLDFFI